MKKKVLNGILLGVAATLCAGGFAACGKDSEEKTQIEEAYASYVAYAEANGGTPLSYEEWLASIKGEKGDKGDKGDDGKSAYEIWLEQGHTGTEDEFLDWLKGINPGEENKLTFKTLEMKDGGAQLTVSNATQEFSFKNEITASGNADYIVALDKYGIHQSSTKTVPLETGDNTFYIFETQGGEIVNTYTAVIRRRPMYTVSFTTDGGTAAESQQVEEGFTATAPKNAPERQGYTFAGWNFDFTQKITYNIKIAAKWTANTNTPYKVEYYVQNLENNDYTLQKTEDLTGTTGATVNAEIKTFEHFSHTEKPYYYDSSESGVIAGDGSLTLKVYYTRDSYTVTFNGNGGTIGSSYYSEGSKTYTVKYGGKVTAPEFTRTGYTQNGWDKELPEIISENITLSAEWQVNRYTLTFVYGNGQPDKQITQDYDTAIEPPEEPARNGYDFAGWNIPETMPAENRTIYAQWNAIFNLNESGDTITGLTYYGKNKTELIIPEEIDGVKITAIGRSAFEYCSSLESITIPDSVTSIGNSAFEGCNKLTYNVKDGLKYLGNAENKYLYLADTNSTTITTAQIDANCRLIGYNAFSGCSSLTSIMIPDSITSIASGVFYNCSSLESITIPDSITSIASGVFYNCSSLSKVYYKGTAEEWRKISIGGSNTITSVKRYYYSETKPTESGNYWHYDENGEIAEW